MSSLDNIVNISITRETQAVAQANFGTKGIIAEFASDKTATTFERYREYAGPNEMIEDGWAAEDEVYKAAVKTFNQNPKVDKIMIGRKDSGDASWTEALAAIQIATQNWYVFSIIASNAATVVFDADFEASNAIVFTINGTAVTSVDFIADHDTTMAALKTQIESDITDSTVTIDATDETGRTLIIEVFSGAGVETASVVVTGGTSQPAGTITFVNSDDYKEAAAWAETQKKLFIYCSSSSLIKDPASETDIAYFFKNSAYERTISCYHPNAQGDDDTSYFETAWPGEILPYDPGSQTWAYKTISALAAYSITSSERTAILGKNCNIYTETAGINVTEEGKVASGEFIDIIRGLDWLESRLQEAVFTDLITVRKIPYTDEGATAIGGTVTGVLEEAARKKILVLESIKVAVPKVTTISSTDRANRNLPDITFEARLQGAVHKVGIRGIVTV